MKIKLFLIVASEGFPVTRQQVKITGSLSAFAEGGVSFQRYRSLRATIPALAAALQSEELIVLAVEPKLFGRTKKNLMAALSLPCEEDPKVLKKLREELSGEERRLSALIPTGAAVFLTKDGLGSGFAIRKGGQELMMLSLDEERLDMVLRNGVVPYLTSGETLESPEGGSAPASAQIGSGGEGAGRTASEVLLRTVNILKEQNSRVAVCGSANSEYLRAFGRDLPSFDELFTFTPFVEDRGDYNLTDYTAQTARAARELASADFGACISDICDRGECAFICVAVAGETSALVRKLYKESGESGENFKRDAAEELLELIGEKASGAGSVGIEVSQSGSEPAENRGPRSGRARKVLLAVLLAILAAVIAVGGYYFFSGREKVRQARQPGAQTQISGRTLENMRPPAGALTLPQLTFTAADGSEIRGQGHLGTQFS